MNASSLRDELERIDRDLFKLTNQRKAIAEAIAAQRSTEAPFLSLPAEIVGEILLWVSVRKPTNLSWSNRDQLCLLRVCKRWHDIATVTPEFWSKLGLKFRLQSILSASEIVSMETWLRRSGDLSIDLTISDGIDNSLGHARLLEWRLRNASWHQSLVALIERILFHLHRCSSIYLCLPSRYICRLFTDPPQRLPRLESLTMAGTRSSDEVPPTVDLSACPRLTDLKCLSQEVSFLIGGQGAAVRDVHLRMDLLDSLTVLACCRYVTRCQLDVVGIAVFFNHHPVLEFPHLTDFGLNWPIYPYHGTFLDRLYLPSLQSLKLVITGFTRDRNPTQPWQHLTHLLQRSSPPLNRLEINPVIGFSLQN